VKTVPEIGVSTNRFTHFVRESKAMFSISNMKSAGMGGTILQPQLDVDRQLSRPSEAPSRIQLIQ
jgi:hypothetical protein